MLPQLYATITKRLSAVEITVNFLYKLQQHGSHTAWFRNGMGAWLKSLYLWKVFSHAFIFITLNRLQYEKGTLITWHSHYVNDCLLYKTGR
jgi:hypothetical protein